MKLLECKDKLTINELLQIAFEYGNDNSDMPADSESITESFNEWLKENDDLFKKLILPHVSKSVDVEREALLKLKQFVANQQDLPEDINQIVNDNFWELF